MYQREHNQLALERLLESQPASNKKPRQTKSKVETKPERIPETAGFLSSYPQEALAVSTAHRSTGDPRFRSGSPVWGDATAGKEPAASEPQPNLAVFQSEIVDPSAFDAVIRITGKFGFEIAKGLPARVLAIAGQPYLRPEKFLDGFVAPQAILSRMQAQPVEPRWKLFKPVLPEKIAGAIQLAVRSFLRWPVLPVVLQDPLPETFEMRLQPISFAPFSPGMACLEERLHRTDRIGFTPP